jgi:hypothetical protein
VYSNLVQAVFPSLRVTVFTLRPSVLYAAAADAMSLETYTVH